MGNLSLCYDSSVKAKPLHPWNVSPTDAVTLQRELASRVDHTPFQGDPRYVAGTDISGVGPDGRVTAAAVVLTYPDLETVECRTLKATPQFPYVPGLLSFREIPVLVPLLESLSIEPDVILVDGQGTAHPRRFGVACHLGLLFDVPSIGCAKSRLVGEFDEPDPEKGAHTDLRHNGEVIGAALRSRTGVKPIFVSVGHRVDLASALRIVNSCLGKFRVPEPTRRSHLAAAGRLPTLSPGNRC